MNRKTFFAGSLVGFLLVWRMFGFAAAPLRSETVAESTLPRVQSMTGDVLASPAIPVTGNQPLLVEGWQLYGLLGLGALLLLLAFLWAAKRADRTMIRRKRPRGKP